MTHVAKRKCCPATTCPNSVGYNAADCFDAFTVSASGFNTVGCCICFFESDPITEHSFNLPSGGSATVVRNVTSWSSLSGGGGCDEVDSCDAQSCSGEIDFSSGSCLRWEQHSTVTCSANLRCVELNETQATNLGLDGAGPYWRAEFEIRCTVPGGGNVEQRCTGYRKRVAGDCCPATGTYEVKVVNYLGTNGPFAPEHDCSGESNIFPDISHAPSVITVS